MTGTMEGKRRYTYSSWGLGSVQANTALGSDVIRKASPKNAMSQAKKSRGRNHCALNEPMLTYKPSKKMTSTVRMR